MNPRSYLYVPGDAPDKLAAAGTRGADAIIIDLEDAVAPTGKAAAREHARRWLAQPRVDAGVELWVRVNAGDAADIEAVGHRRLTGVCAPKVRGPDDIAELDAELTRAESHAGLRPRSLKVMALIETAAGVLSSPAIARSPRVARLQLGEADLAADAGIEPGPAQDEFLHARSQLVLACAAANLAAPIAPVSGDFTDLAALRNSTRALRRLGFFGRACIHPAQIPVVHDTFTSSAAELAEFADLRARHEEALRAGRAVIVDRGRMIDSAVIDAMRRRLNVDVEANDRPDTPRRAE